MRRQGHADRPATPVEPSLTGRGASAFLGHDARTPIITDTSSLLQHSLSRARKRGRGRGRETAGAGSRTPLVPEKPALTIQNIGGVDARAIRARPAIPCSTGARGGRVPRRGGPRPALCPARLRQNHRRPGAIPPACRARGGGRACRMVAAVAGKETVTRHALRARRRSIALT